MVGGDCIFFFIVSHNWLWNTFRVHHLLTRPTRGYHTNFVWCYQGCMSGVVRWHGQNATHMRMFSSWDSIASATCPHVIDTHKTDCFLKLLTNLSHHLSCTAFYEGFWAFQVDGPLTSTQKRKRGEVVSVTDSIQILALLMQFLLCAGRMWNNLRVVSNKEIHEFRIVNLGLLLWIFEREHFV